MNEYQITVDPADLVMMIHGIHELTEGLCAEIYMHTPEGVLTYDKRFSAGDNAADFIKCFYELTSGAIRLTAAATGVLSEAFANGELGLMPPENKAEVKQSA